ncbi:MAG: response regulator [Bdellovibrionaceae bacterium]|nr:response regulator [Pseudobdellovibrionaceae bacterium]
MTGRILLLGNEADLAEPLAEKFRGAGHQVYLAGSPAEATALISKNQIDYAFVDCLLSGTNGVDWINQVRAAEPNLRTKFVLSSFFYTNEQFIAESLRKTQAVSFLIKENSHAFFEKAVQLIKIDKHTKKTEDADAQTASLARRQLYQIFSKEKVSARDKRKIIESLEEVSGFDLPFIYNLLSETKTSGYLNIYSKDGSVSGVTFAKGNIVAVDVQDQKTYLGEMLIQSGYVSVEEVQLALQEKNNQKLGKRLIQANLLSPHAFHLILSEQLNIRLSRTIVDTSVKVNFATSEDIEITSPAIDSEMLMKYLHEWVASKIPEHWLKSLYMSWSFNSIQKTNLLGTDHPVLEMPLVCQVPGLLEAISKGATLSSLRLQYQKQESALYKALHFLLLKGLIVFAGRGKYQNEEEQIAALRRLQDDLKDRDDRSVLSYLGFDRDVSLRKVEEDFYPLLGDRPSTPEALKIWTAIRDRVEQAVIQIENSFEITRSQESEANKVARARIEAASLMEEVKTLLQQGNFAQAMELLNKVQSLDPRQEHFRIYMAWARVGLIKPENKSQALKEIEFEIMQVPAEEKYDPHYAFVSGLYFKAKGDYSSAKRSFEKALALNSSIIYFRRELAATESLAKNSRDSLSGGLGGLIGGLFGKK